MKAHNSQVAPLKVEPLKRLDEDVDGEPEHFDSFHVENQLMITMRKGKVQKKKIEKKLTNVSFMYVCVAGNGDLLFFFPFFPPTIV